MLLIGKKLDPQPPSDGGDRPRRGAHLRTRPRSWPRPRLTITVTITTTITRMTTTTVMITATATITTRRCKFLIKLICPGMVLLSFIFSRRARCGSFPSMPERVHQVIQFTWIAGLPFHMANGQLATFSSTGASCSTRSAP